LKDKVSIIIPSHNKADYILDSIESALNQTWTNIEVIVVDDCSTDCTKEILSKINDERLKVHFVGFKNASAARNFGINKSDGDFIQFLDADDILKPEKIRTQLIDMDFKTDVLGVTNTNSFYESIKEDGNEIDTEFLKFSENPFAFICNMFKSVDSGMVQPNAWLVPRQIIDASGFWNESLSVDDDGEFFCRVILQSKKIIHTDKILNYYRKYKIASSNLSAQKTETGFTSMLNSALLKKEHLENYVSKNKIVFNLKPIFNSLLVNVMVASYPKFKGISNTARKHLDYKEELVLPKLGGKSMEFLKKITSWKIAKQIHSLINFKNVL
jgi:glycosyltransferase involved in cell wall biosynthesis